MQMKTLDIKYIPNPMKYFWKIQPKPLELDDATVAELCQYCNSTKDEQIVTLKRDNEKLNKLIKFLQAELRALELKTNVSEKAILIKDAVKEYSATLEGKGSLKKAWDEQYKEWSDLVKNGEMSKIKYYRLVSGINQHELARKLNTKQPNIARIEKVGYQPNVDTLKKLAKIFSIPVEDLIEK
jgi:DNA-binding XRE family transcriptional regulator